MHWGCAQLVCAGDLSCVSGIGCAVTSGGGCVQKSPRNGPEDDRAVMLYRSKAGKLAGSLPQLLVFPCFFSMMNLDGLIYKTIGGRLMANFKTISKVT